MEWRRPVQPRMNSLTPARAAPLVADAAPTGRDGPISAPTTVVTNRRSTKSRNAVGIHRVLPSEYLIHGELVALAGLVQTQEAAAKSGQDLGFSAHDPALGCCGWQVGSGERQSIWTDHVARQSWLVGHRRSLTQIGILDSASRAQNDIPAGMAASLKSYLG